MGRTDRSTQYQAPARSPGRTHLAWCAVVAVWATVALGDGEVAVATALTVAALVATVGADRGDAGLLPQGHGAARVRRARGRAGRVFSLRRRRSRRAAQARALPARSFGGVDEVTGLDDRRALGERLRLALRPGADPAGAVVLAVDVVGFRRLNESLGHTGGDRLLRQLGERLAHCCGSGIALGRLGGDRFGLVGTGGEFRARSLARRIQRALDAPFSVDGLSFPVEVRIGAALAPDHGEDADLLLARAELARDGGAGRSGMALFDPGHEPTARSRFETTLALRRDLGAGRVLPYYQPKFAAPSGRLVGVEALARWVRTDGNVLPPGAFLPLAEEAGLVGRITDAMLDASLAQMRTWLAAGTAVPSVSVNVPASSLVEPDFAAAVAARLAAHGVEPSRLVIEITEDTLLSDESRGVRTLDELRSRGVEVSLDDYGTGYSSLAFMRDLPLDEVKLDRTFGMRLDTDPRTLAIVASTVGLTRALGLRLVVEGVETAHSARLLAELGCDVVQGFHLAPPLAAADVAQATAGVGQARPALAAVVGSSRR